MVSNVSDTARWIAAVRAIESRRPDALFHDHLADRLSGPAGYDIIARLPPSARGSSLIVARVKIIDDMILQAVAAGADTVVNLAAGLDTRPYRLKLPPSLLWIDADLPAITEEKERALANEVPLCQLRREKIDLSNRAALSAFLDKISAASKNICVISEGLVMYLEPSDVETLSRELFARPAIKTWINNITSPAVNQAINRAFRAALGNVKMKFAPADGVAFFENHGWQTAEVLSMLHAAAKFKRLPWIIRLLVPLIPEPNPRNPRYKWGAVVRLVHPSS